MLSAKVPLETGNGKPETGSTGPSTNGRSSAFGALCLGSNPSGPAKTVSGEHGQVKEMIRIQIVEREGAQLLQTLKSAIRSGALRTFDLHRRGHKVTHRSKDYHGWMNWDSKMGVVTCEILSPKMPGQEWKILSSFVGRLADRYGDRVHSIGIQFCDEVGRKRRPRQALGSKSCQGRSSSQLPVLASPRATES